MCARQNVAHRSVAVVVDCAVCALLLEGRRRQQTWQQVENHQTRAVSVAFGCLCELSLSCVCVCVCVCVVSYQHVLSNRIIAVMR